MTITVIIIILIKIATYEVEAIQSMQLRLKKYAQKFKKEKKQKISGVQNEPLHIAFTMHMVASYRNFKFHKGRTWTLETPTS